MERDHMSNESEGWNCAAPVVCLPDGLSAMCETCVQEHLQALAGEGAE
jgi:hypothetical protein